jgi:hypothetical protein
VDFAYSPALAAHVRKEWREGVEQLRVLPRRSWKVVGLAAALVLFHEGHAIFHPWGKGSWLDTGWEVLISFALLMLLLNWVGEFFGTETWSVSGGELIVSRGIGRLRRTFRYKVNGIRELMSDGPSNAGQARPKVHYIFHKPESGAVRFAYEGKTIAFAEWLDESEGEQIVRWLQARLPRSASELVLGARYQG